MVPKFRCWDGQDMVMRDVEQLRFPSNSNNHDIYIVIDGEEWATGPALVLMQSTGLKDKNGVEIFEGDLVKNFSNINKFTDDFAEDIEPTYGTTSIVRDGACFKTTFKGLPSLVLNQNGGSMAKHMEVIGNVWENPELWEQADE